jgi:hypothetical protein
MPPLRFAGESVGIPLGAEKRIRDLQDLARTMLVHAKHRWPRAVNAHLWPYALRMAANDVHKHAPLKSGKTPIELFTGTDPDVATKHFHPFGHCC